MFSAYYVNYPNTYVTFSSLSSYVVRSADSTPHFMVCDDRASAFIISWQSSLIKKGVIDIFLTSPNMDYSYLLLYSCSYFMIIVFV